jgi:hypothetical protein
MLCPMRLRYTKENDVERRMRSVLANAMAEAKDLPGNLRSADDSMVRLCRFEEISKSSASFSMTVNCRLLASLIEYLYGSSESWWIMATIVEGWCQWSCWKETMVHSSR